MTEQQDMERLADIEAEEGRMKPEVLDPPTTKNWFYILVLIILGFLAGILFSTAAYAHEYLEGCDNHTIMSEKMRDAGYKPFFVGISGDDEDYALIIWTNDGENIWMLHELYIEQDMQCHLMVGKDYADRSVLGDPV